ncbi:MAG: hypothetical protein AAF149_11880 [Bacteroidota bacterium]
MDKNKIYLYELLYSALIQIREDAYEKKNKKVFWISNLLHNLPAQLMQDDVDYEKILEKIIKKAEHDKMGEWLNNEIEFIDKSCIKGYES